MTFDVTPGSALDILGKAASESYLAAEAARASRSVIRLDDFRPKPAVPDPPASASDWRLIDEFCEDLLLCESVQGQVRAILGATLLACLDSEVAPIAQTYWYAIKSTIVSPLGVPKAGESWYQPALDKLRTVDLLAAEFWRNIGRDCPRYDPRHLMGADRCN
jgi:hypothetical protein